MSVTGALTLCHSFVLFGELNPNGTAPRLPSWWSTFPIDDSKDLPWEKEGTSGPMSIAASVSSQNLVEHLPGPIALNAQQVEHATCSPLHIVDLEESDLSSSHNQEPFLPLHFFRTLSS